MQRDLERLSLIAYEAIAYGVLRDASIVDCSEEREEVAFQGQTTVEEIEVILRVVLTKHFPLIMPKVYLKPWDALGFIPHIDSTEGLICHADADFVVLDRQHSNAIIEETIRRATSVLRDGVLGNNHSDFTDEFEAHWLRVADDTQIVFSLLYIPEQVTKIVLAHDQSNDIRYVANDHAGLTDYWNGQNQNENEQITFHKAILLPLESNTRIIPPRPDQAFWTPEQARDILLSELSQSNVDQLKRLVKGHRYLSAYVFVAIPRPSGGWGLIGLEYKGVKGRHPLLEQGTARRLIPLRIERHDRRHLVQRGGGVPILSEKNVLLAGCGSLGGHIAFELARAGVGKLSLVDDDLLLPENSFRHVLGRQYWRQHKAEALRHAIYTQLPYIRIKQFVCRIEDILRDHIINLKDYDLVISATGNVTVELFLNEHLHYIRNSPPAIYAWLDPLGIGGHMLLTHNQVGAGCLECLYTHSTPQDHLTNRVSFAASGQRFGRDLSGCGSLHTPYGSIDAVRTANLASQLAIEVLTGKEDKASLVSWKGDASLFEELGFELSPRFGFSQDELNEQRYRYKSSECRICNSSEGS